MMAKIEELKKRMDNAEYMIKSLITKTTPDFEKRIYQLEEWEIPRLEHRIKKLEEGREKYLQTKLEEEG